MQYQKRLTHTAVDRSAVKICVCRKCSARYEPLEFQSMLYCSFCQPPSTVQPVCVHSVSLHLGCERCKAMYGSDHMRNVPQVHAKRGPKPVKIVEGLTDRPKRITMTRVKAASDSGRRIPA